MPSPRKPTAEQADWVGASAAEACEVRHCNESCRFRQTPALCSPHAYTHALVHQSTPLEPYMPTCVPNALQRRHHPRLLAGGELAQHGGLPHG